MKTIGFVNDIRRQDSKQIVTVVLNYEELQADKLILGEFIIVKSGASRKFLSRVESCYYAPVSLSKVEQNAAQSTGRLNNQMDQSSVKYINFMHYDLGLLGELPTSGNKFSAGVREVPSLMEVEVYRPDQAELQAIVDAKVPGDSGVVKTFQLGLLQYGTRESADGKSPALPSFPVKVSFNVNNLQPKRTAVFGKTGYGKSNLIKTLISLMHRFNPGTAQLIFDVNGEYAFSNKQGPGLLEIFKDSGNEGDIVVYSNRVDALKKYGSEVVKSIKFDVIENPDMAVSLVVGKRRQRDRGDADYLDALLDPDMHTTIRSFWRCFCVQELGLQTAHYHKAGYKTANNVIDDFEEAHGAILAASKAGSTAKNLTGKTGQFAFLKRIHYLDATSTDDGLKGNFFNAIKSDLASGKIIIIDLPSVDSNLLAPLSDKIAGDLFKSTQEKFLITSVTDTVKTSVPFNVLVYVEEAHNVLSDNQNTIFPRIAREGRKYGLGLVYSTQRPGSIDEDILTQTENFFVMHMGSEDDTNCLRRAKIAFANPISDFILTEPAVGVAYVYSEPYQPYVLSCRVRLFDDVLKEQ